MKNSTRIYPEGAKHVQLSSWKPQIMKNKNLISLSGKMKSGKNTVADIIQYLTDKSSARYTYTPCEKDFREYMKNAHKDHTKWELKFFGYKLKLIASILLGVSVEKFEDQEYKNSILGKEWWYHKIDDYTTPYSEYPNPSKPWYGSDNIKKPTVRDFLQRLGTEAMREQIHPNAWCVSLFVDYKPSRKRTLLERVVEGINEGVDIEHEKYPNWLISDMRFHNELEAVKKRQGLTIRVERDTELRFPEEWKEFQLQTEDDIWGDFLTSINMYDTVYHPSETSLDNIADWDYVINNNDSIDSLILEVLDMMIELKLIEDK